MFSSSKALFRKPGGGATPTTDASFAYVPLLLETGSSSSLNTTVTDSSASPNTVTRTGNPSTGWVSPYQTDGYWGNFFPGGASDTLNIATNAIPASGAFTFETFVYPTGTAASQVIAAQYPNGSASGRLMILWNDTTNKFTVVLGATTVFVSDATYSANTWLYLVVQRDASNVWSMYVNGARNTATVTNATAIDTAVTYIGNRNTGGTPYTGYISNLRVVTSALYSGSTISVPTTPFSVSTTNQVLLTCYSNRFIDANTATTAKVITVTGTPQVTPYFYPSGFTAPAASPGAIYFAANGTYLTAGSAAALALGAGDFTVELWLYVTAYNSNTSTVVDWRTNGGVATNIPALFLSTTGVPTFYANISSGALITGSSAVPLNTWTHLAIVRSGTGASNVKMYLNGVSTGSGTNTSTLGIETFSVNNAQGSPQNIYVTYGYIGNLRIVKGTAVYTGTPFTPPSGPLTQTGGTYPSLTNVVTGFSAANTSLLLNLADSNYTSATNGVQNNTFIDTGPYAFPITRNGTPTQGSITPYWPNGQWSNYFVAASSQTILTTETQVIPTGNFTIELFVYVTSTTATQAFVSQGTSGSAGRTAIGIDNSSGAKWFCQVGGVFVYSSAAPTLNTWNYLAMTYNGATIALYLNGTLLNSASNTTSAQNSQLRISGLWATPVAGYYLDGYLSNVRVSNTVRTVTSIPTAPFTSDANTTLLTCQGNRFVDVSGTPKTLTPSGTPTVQAFQPFSPTASYTTALYGGSGYFNGSTDYVGAANNTAFDFGSGNFTIEFWFNQISRLPSNYDGPFRLTGSMYFTMGNGPSGYALVVTGGGTIVLGTPLPSLNTWHHMAVVRNGSTFTVYLDGISIGTSTYAGAVGSPSGAFQVGWAGTFDSYFNGYISNFRAVKGTAVYTGAFTPPTSPVTAITNTSLLLNMTNAGIYDATTQNVVTTVGDAQVSTTQYKWSPTSMKFDGTGDYLLTSIPSLTGVFTIEFWVYIASAGNNYFFTIGDALNSTGLEVYLGTAGTAFNLYSAGASRITSATLPTPGAWNYVAVTRDSSNVIRLYLAGTQVGSTYTSSAAFATTLRVGVELYNSILTYGNCYIQDFRITNGVARTITTPTAAFPTR